MRSIWILAAWFALAPGLAGQLDAGRPYEATQPRDQWLVLERIAEQRSLKSDVDAVVDHLRRMLGNTRPAGRLSRIADTLANPWDAPQRSARLRDDLLSPLAGREVDFSRLAVSLAPWIDVVVDALEDIRATPLYDGGPRLADIPLHKRLNELEFHVPVAHGSAAFSSTELAERARSVGVSLTSPTSMVKVSV